MTAITKNSLIKRPSLQILSWKTAGFLLLASGFVLAQGKSALANAISLTSPPNGTSITSPVTIIASDTGYKGVTATQIYADGVLSFTTPSTSINTSLNLPVGTHTLVAKVWYNNGLSSALSNSSAIHVTAGSTPPSGSTAFNSSHYLNAKWNLCGACGNSDPGSGPTVDYVIGGVPNTTGSGSSTILKFDLAKVNGAYADGYAYVENGARSTLVNYVSISMNVYIPNEFANTKQQIEFEAQQEINGLIYDFAWAANYKGGNAPACSSGWCTWTYDTKTWHPTGIANTLTAGVWHTITATFHATQGQVHYDTLTVDGTTHPINQVQPAASGQPGNNQFTNAIQLDSDSSATPYYIYVDNLKVVVNP